MTLKSLTAEQNLLPVASIDDVKKRADRKAAAACMAIRVAYPMDILIRAVQPNFKFYRRMAGLRNGDLVREA